SKGNVVAPQSVMKDLGADVLRLWVASTDYRGEMSVSNEILNRTSDGYRRLRNTARFLLSNLSDFDPGKDLVATPGLLALDRWIMDRAYLLQEEIIAHYEAYQFQQIYQKVHNFCSLDLSSFYLDVIKDRQYTAKADGLARRSSQTVQYHLLEALVRWLAPIISYTADEIWSYLPGERGTSVFLETWYQGLVKLDDNTPMNKEFWQQIMAVRSAVSKELEKYRSKGDIGSSLDAEIELYCNPHYFGLLQQFEDELRFVLITSNASVMAENTNLEDAIHTDIDGIKLKVMVSTNEKCVRCWHHQPDVGQHSTHPELCGRCIENVDGNGEQRRYA
ncbi:partial isoleucyl-tRNA synthetase, partial [biofilm metagenome]